MDLFERYSGNPIVYPTMSGGGAKDYNSGVIRCLGVYYMFFRKYFPNSPGQDNWHSEIWRAESCDGRNWTNFRPFLVPDPKNPDEKRGFEDPRIVYVEHFGYVLTYAVYDGRIVKMHVATSSDLDTWEFHGAMPHWPFVDSGGVHINWESDPLETVGYNPLWPDGPDIRSKSGSAASKLIDGRLHFVLGEGGIWVASCEPDFTEWQISSEPLLAGRPGTGLPDEVTVEAGPPLIWKAYGWLMLYHGINRQRKYQLMVAVLSHDLTQVLWRSTDAIFGPKEIYETRPGAIDVIPGVPEAVASGDEVRLKKILDAAAAKGEMPGVTFVSACVEYKVGRVICIYYGARDEVICMASVSLDAIEALIPWEIIRVPPQEK